MIRVSERTHAGFKREADRRGVTIERDHVAAYADVCGFRRADLLPPTYLHLLGFPLSMHLLTSPAFPYPPTAGFTAQTRPSSGSGRLPPGKFTCSITFRLYPLRHPRRHQRLHSSRDATRFRSPNKRKERRSPGTRSR